MNWLIVLMLSGVAMWAQAETVDAEVVQIDAAKNTITLKHNGVKSLDMPAMKMKFDVQDAASLSGLAEGDTVQFSPEKNASNRYVANNLKKKP